MNKIFLALVALIFLLTSYSIGRGSDEPQVYKNDKYGISITGPKGWYMDSKELNTGRRTRLVKFDTMLSGGPQIDIHQIDFLVKLANVKTPLEYANFHTAELQKNTPGFTLIEGPKEITLNNVPVVKVTYIGYLQSENYYFSKDNSIFCLSICAWPKEFDKFRKWYDECINTFTLK